MRQAKKTLRQWRRERDMTQVELADAVGLTDRTLNHFERHPEALRNTKYKTIVAICDALNIKVGDIFIPTTSKR